MESPFDEQRALVAAYDFREVHPHLRVGTASDRYAGWLGQIYPEETWATQVTTRTKKLGGQAFEEKMLPVESVADYFAHFSVLELDFTFYRPLLERDGKASPNLYVLQQYAEHAPPDALFLLKAPQTFFARRLRRSKGGNVSYEDNPDFLDADTYTRCFHEPARDLLQERLLGVLFEQEYARVQDSPEPEENVAELDRFFAQVPRDVQPHVELRSPHLLTAPYFDWLAENGIGFVFSHWTWLPPLREQWKLTGGRFTAADGNAVCRLLTPLRTKYAEAYAQAYPFEQPVPALAESEGVHKMVLDAVALTYQAEAQDAALNLILNNRAYGNSPALGQRIASRVLDEEEKRMG